MRLSLYCTCGAGAEGEIDPKGEARFRQAWESVHTGTGHAPCDKATAKAAERKKKA